MSAWIVSKAHIDVLVHEMGRRELLDCSPNEAGRILWEENHKSVNYRYDETEQTPAYTFTRPPVEWQPAAVAKIAHCYDYQTCEHPEWAEGNRSYDWIRTLLTALQEQTGLDSKAIQHHPDYDTAPWGVSLCGQAHESWQDCEDCERLYDALEATQTA